MPYIPPRAAGGAGPSARPIPRSTYNQHHLGSSGENRQGTIDHAGAGAETGADSTPNPTLRKKDQPDSDTSPSPSSSSTSEPPLPSSVPPHQLPASNTNLAKARTQSSHPDEGSWINPDSFPVQNGAGGVAGKADVERETEAGAEAETKGNELAIEQSSLQTEDHLTPRPDSRSHSHSHSTSQTNSKSASLPPGSTSASSTAPVLTGKTEPRSGESVPNAQPLSRSTPTSPSAPSSDPPSVPIYPDPATALSDQLARSGSALDIEALTISPPPVNVAAAESVAMAEDVDNQPDTQVDAAAEGEGETEEEAGFQPHSVPSVPSVPSLSSTSPSSYASVISLSEQDEYTPADGDGDGDGEGGAGAGGREGMSSATSMSISASAMAEAEPEGAEVGEMMDQALARYKYWLYNYTNGLYLAARISANKAEEKRMRQGEYSSFSGSGAGKEKQSGMERMAAKKALARRLNA